MVKESVLQNGMIEVLMVYKKLNAIILFIPDGDTLIIKLNGKKELLRMLPVDSPESVHPEKPLQPYGKASCSFVRNIVPIGKIIQVELDACIRDKYGRLLAYAYIDGAVEYRHARFKYL